MEVQPIVFRKLVLQDFHVPHLLVRDFSVFHHESNGIVPGEEVWRNIHRDLRRLLQPDRIHVVVFSLNFGVNLTCLNAGELLKQHTPDPALCGDRLCPVEHERAAPVIQEPVDFDILGQRPVGDAVRFQIVGLLQVHRDENLLSIDDTRKGEEEREKEFADHMLSPLNSRILFRASAA